MKCLESISGSPKIVWVVNDKLEFEHSLSGFKMLAVDSYTEVSAYRHILLIG